MILKIAPLQGVAKMSKIITNSSEEYFAALKLIELLYIEGHIPDFMFRNILNEAEDDIDITQFKIFKN